MSILTKILMGLVVVAVLPVLYFSAAVLRVNDAWRDITQKYEQAVEAQEAQNFDKLHGDVKARVEPYVPGKLSSGTPGVLQYEVARDNLKLGRGRFWYAVPVGDSVDEAAGLFKVNILDANIEDANRQPLTGHGIKDRSFLYVFQLRHDGTPDANDKYIGEFVVEGLPADATDALVPLKPALPMEQAKWDLIKGNANQWLIYEHMPIDDRNVFSDLQEDKIRERLPASVVAEYLNDGKAPTDEVMSNEKLKAHVVENKDTGEKVFLRPLRDYQQIFRNLALRTVEINDRVAILKKEHAYAIQAEKNAKTLIEALDARYAKLTEEKKLLEAELAAVRAHGMKLDALLAQLQQQLQMQLAENKRLADEIMGLGRKTAALEAPAEAAARTP